MNEWGTTSSLDAELVNIIILCCNRISSEVHSQSKTDKSDNKITYYGGWLRDAVTTNRMHPALSGVTRVGDTRGSNWWVSPYFFLKKSDNFFSHRLWKTFLAVVSSPSIFPRCLSSVLAIFSHKKNNFSRVSPGRSAPTQCVPSPSYATACTADSFQPVLSVWQRVLDLYEWILISEV